MNGRNQSIDALRGIAILLVLGNHFPYYGIWGRIGWSGVYLFFVLSGFLVSGILFDSFEKTGGVQIRRFIIRRGFKIWPSFYAYLVPVALLALVTPGAFPGAILRDAALFIGNYTSTDYIPFTRHIWSLCVEEHFYLLLPLLFWICTRWMGRRGLAAIGWICVASIPFCCGLRAIQVLQGITSPPYTHIVMDSLFCGVGLAYLYRFRKEAFHRLSSRWCALAGAAFLVPIFLFDPHAPLMRTLGLTSAAIGFSLLLAWAVDRRPAPGIGSRCIGALAKVGFYSYGIYLWHMVAQTSIEASVGKGFLGFWIYVLVAIILGTVMSRNTEQPFLRIRDRFFPDTRTARRPGVESSRQPARDRLESLSVPS